MNNTILKTMHKKTKGLLRNSYSPGLFLRGVMLLAVAASGLAAGAQTPQTITSRPAYTGDVTAAFFIADVPGGVTRKVSGATILNTLRADTNSVLATRTWVLQNAGSGTGTGGAVSSVFGRTGPVTALASDYSSFFVSMSGSYTNPPWLASLDSTKVPSLHSVGYYNTLYGTLSAQNTNAANIATILSYYNGSVIKPTSLPIGSSTALGAYKVGSGLSVDGTGVLSATGGTGGVAPSNTIQNYLTGFNTWGTLIGDSVKLGNTYTAAPGTVSTSDNVKQAIQKLDGSVQGNTTAIAKKLDSIGVVGKNLVSYNQNNGTVKTVAPIAQYFYQNPLNDGDELRLNAADTTWRNYSITRNSGAALKMVIYDTVAHKKYYTDISGTSASGRSDSISRQSGLPAFGSTTYSFFNTADEKLYILNTGKTHWLRFSTTDSVAVSLPPGSDPDAAAFITAASVANADTAAVQTFVRGLKSAGLWTKAKVIYPLYGTAFSQGKYNLVNTSLHTLTQTGGGTFANGFTNVASATNGLYTDVNPGTYSNLYTLVVSVKTDLSATQVDFGVLDAGAGTYILSRTTGNQVWMNATIASTGAGLQVANSSSIGRFYMVSNSGNEVGYKNGSNIGSFTRTPGTSTNAFVIGNGGTSNLPSTRKISVAAIFDNTLTDADVASLDTLIANFETALGR